MVSIKQLEKYCNGYFTKIENYEKAISDQENMWECHHRREDSGYSMQELKDLDLYFGVPPEDLILYTSAEHMRLHNTGNTYRLGKAHTAETKKKMSNSHKSTPKVYCKELDRVFDSYAECNREIAEYLGLKYFNVGYVIREQEGHYAKGGLTFIELIDDPNQLELEL